MTRAEALAVALLSTLITAVLLPHIFDALGGSIFPSATAAASLLVGLALVVAARWSAPAQGDMLVFLIAFVATLAVTGWVAWPSLLPPGSGSDLTHHLLLADYIERHGTLVHDPGAAAAIGEMASYTPGIHILAAIAGVVFRTSAFEMLYPVVALSVALKFSLFALCVLRLVARRGARVAIAIAALGVVFHATAYTFGAFLHDSFLAQVVGELFAIAMWWALIVWWQAPSAWTMWLFGLCGAATFLTWPVWLGAPVATLALLLVVRPAWDTYSRTRHAVAALLPIALAVALHSVGRTGGVALLGTSGAVSLPAPAVLDWAVLALAVLGVAVSFRDRAARPLLAFLGALALEAAALFVIARRSGADTAYMAVKMAYLAVYPIIAAAMFAVAGLLPGRRWQAVAAVAMLALASRHIASLPRSSPVVSADLFDAGRWARDHAPPGCMDYLVGNEYTAYWLHLAVLRNPRSSSRSTDNSTYSTEASFARWIADEGAASHAVARWSLLPADIRDRSRVLYRTGDAAVLSRRITCPN